MPTEGREHWSIGAIGLSLILTLPLATLTVRFFATYSNNVAATANCEPLTQAMERQDENQSFEDNLIFALDHFSIKSNMKKSINSCKNISDGEGVNKILKAIFSK